MKSTAISDRKLERLSDGGESRSRRRAAPSPAKSAATTQSAFQVPALAVVGASHNNLKDITVEIPLGRFVCVTGVSGSGKSSLVNDILREALARDLNGAETATPGTYERIDGIEHLDKCIDIDQSAIGRTPRSNPGTYIKVFDQIRDLYARLPDSKVRGYKPGRFSFNVSTGKEGGGRCEACEGNGSNRMEMELLADVWVTCPLCGGKRFSRETLQILYKGRSIADVLEMDVQQALTHFENVPAIANMLKTLHDVGLDYIKLGQSSTTLSGGEAQRIKLARELVKKSTGRTLYILDEPTTGLHFADIKRLLSVLHGFVDAGNTVVVIEHNLDVIKTADWLIDLGPEGGDAGGEIVASGTPEEVAQCARSYTGHALKALFEYAGEETTTNGRHRKGRGIQRPLNKWNDASGGNEISRYISVVGAAEHNLKSINVEFPRDKMTVCCGPSGSGKSSFAVDTVYSEGQRRYVESLSSYARQFLGRLQPPKVEHIHGLSPAICIEQKNTSRSPRSTVGTVTEIFDYMRVLWARLGIPYCPLCKTPVAALTSDEIVEGILAIGEGVRLHLLAPIEPAEGETFTHLLERERANGFTRVRVDGVNHALDETFAIDEKDAHRVELIVDRVILRKNQRGRLSDSVEQALTIGKGVVIAGLIEGSKDEISGDAQEKFLPVVPREFRFSKHRSCNGCGQVFEELTPHHFSFNTRMGWCEACEGLGTQEGASQSSIVAHPTRSLIDGAIAGWVRIQGGMQLHAALSALAERLGFELSTPWNKLNEAQQFALMHGCDDWLTVKLPVEGNDRTIRFRWRGFFPAIGRAARSSADYRSRLSGLTAEAPCEACQGSRLRPEPAQVRVKGITLNEIGLRSLSRALEWFGALRLAGREKKIAGELVHEISSRLAFLVDVGLDYLTLNRAAATLSGGEAQRIQLASQIGTGLTGVLYVLDEPTIGLHPRDNARLIGALNRLRDLGNTLLLVEHDREVIDAADHVLDFGPGAGKFGGNVTAATEPRKLRKHAASLTGKYLSGREAIAVPSNRRPVDRREWDLAFENHRVRSKPTGAQIEIAHWLTIQAARENNLKEIDVAFPLGRFTCVTGVSGSGKSTLVSDILYNAVASRLHRANVTIGAHHRIGGMEHIDKVINVDQSPIGNTPTSNPATYVGAFDSIRELFAKMPMSKVRGYTPNRFSFNRAGGRCEACEGMGQRCIEMHFLPDVWVECENCRGARYVPETLEVKYREKSIAHVLNLSIAEAAELFANVPRIFRMIKTLDDVGLGYLALGQAATTLSGGEAQRVKLAAELGKPSTGKTLYILDEPTTGLHFDDLKKLLEVLHRLVDLGNTVICIEHNLDVIKTADWVIDLGPEAGDAGGEVVVVGTPEEIVECAKSHTGRALKPLLEMGPVAERAAFVANSPVKSGKKLSLVADVGGEVNMPWEIDGRAWHTTRHADTQGRMVEWDGGVLAWIADTIEKFAKLEPTNWNHRTRVEMTAAKNGAWFCHVLTGFKDLLEVCIRVPSGTFTEARLRAELGVKTLDERGDLPIYGESHRVQIRTLSGAAGGWDSIRISLRDFKDVSRPAFSRFLKTATQAYLRHIEKMDQTPQLKEPWKVDGRQWHLSQKSMSARQLPKWKPAYLMTLLGQFGKLQPDLRLDWETKTALMMHCAGVVEPIGKIVTNMGRGLRVELRAPLNMLTPAMIDRIGEEPSIKRCRDQDWLIFWTKSWDSIDVQQLRSTWAICRAGSLEQRRRPA